jgi:DeoR family transcriptional regulator, fructose operon transcriptional repressor
MLAIERQNRILSMLSTSRAITTVKVAKKLGISEETVRRDFEKLEADGHLLRKHGGAALVHDTRRDLSLDSRQITNIAEKETIAKLALGQIQAGDTIFFDASSTVFHLACLLSNLEVTVLTTGLKVAGELARRPSIQLILIGGAVSRRSLSCEGSLANQVLEQHYVQKAFLSCRGFDPEHGFSESNVEQAALKRKVMSVAGQTILLVDHSKFGVKSPYLFARTEDINTLITDRQPGIGLRQSLQKNHRKLIVPEEK